MALITVIAQYAALGLVVGFVFYREAVIRFVTNLTQPSPPSQPPAQDTKLQKKKPTKITSKPVKDSSSQEQSAALSSAVEKEKTTDDAAFARDLALAQKGTDLTKKSDKKSRPSRTKKQAQAEEEEVVGQLAEDTIPVSEQSIDDKAHPAPTIPAIKSGGAAGMETDYGSHVASMLRIAPEDVLAPVPREAEWTSVPTKSQKVQKKAERAEETKKQRQRQAQKDQYREMKEEADKKQRALMEKQMREARIARGEPARNGESYREASAPRQSAWSLPANSTDGAEHHVLLDTMDEAFRASKGPVIANGEGAVDSEGAPTSGK